MIAPIRAMKERSYCSEDGSPYSVLPAVAVEIYRGVRGVVAINLRASRVSQTLARIVGGCKLPPARVLPSSTTVRDLLRGFLFSLSFSLPDPLKN